MQPNTLYIHLTASALFLAKEEKDDEPHLELTRSEVSPYTPFATALDEALAAKKTIDTDVEKVRIFVDSPVALIPMAEFSEETFRPYYDYCIPSDKERRIFCDPLPAANAMLVFSVAENIYKTLEDRFENIHFSSSMTHMTGYFIKRNSYRDTPKRMLVALREDAVDIIAVESGRLLAVNSFETGAESDVVYYTLGIAEKLGISTETDTFYIAGDAASRSSVVAKMEELARNVRVMDASEDFSKYILQNGEEIPFNLLTALAGT